MNLSDVVVFVSVARERSFTRAARMLELPKSTVSERIARLEASLGVRLFDRTTRALRLTSSGIDYFDRVRPLVQGIEEASDAVSSAHQAPRGILRIGAPLLVAQSFLADLVADFLGLYPDVEIELVLQEHASAFDLVHDRLDLAIHVFGTLEPSHIVRKLGSSRRILVASPDYVSDRGAPREPADLKAHACVVTGPTRKMVWSFVRDDGAGAVDVAVTGRYAVTSLELVQRAVLRGLGMSALPLFLCMDHVDKGRLVRVMPGWSLPDATVHVVYPSGQQLPARTRAFADLLIERSAEKFDAMNKLATPMAVSGR